MGIVWSEKFGSATVILRDEECQCSPQEQEERRWSFDLTVARVLSDQKVQESLRRIYGDGAKSAR